MAKVRSKERHIYSLRLAAPERRLLEEAAAKQQEHMSEFIRRTALAAARHELSDKATVVGRSLRKNAKHLLVDYFDVMNRKHFDDCAVSEIEQVVDDIIGAAVEAVAEEYRLVKPQP